MIVILAGILASAAFVLLVRILWSKAQPKKFGGMVTLSVIALIVGLVLLAASGRMHWLAALGAALFPFIRRFISQIMLMRLFQHFKLHTTTNNRENQASGPEHSEVETEDLRMTLHHSSGHMDGEILLGKFRGRLLSELDLEELNTLRIGLRDPQSQRLLDSYLDRHFSDRTRDNTKSSTSEQTIPNAMTKERALEVLGLKEGASNEDVIYTHRRLIQKLHPDRGGSSFLAATLNEAKQILLKR
jgi:hypothetical protein